MTKLSVNRKQYEVDADPNTPLLWVIRDDIGLTGTKFGCGVAQCGACTMHVERRGEAFVRYADEGRRRKGDHDDRRDVAGRRRMHCKRRGSQTMFRSAATASRARSCRPRYCSKENKKPTDADIDQAMSGVICRCGTYNRIRERDQDGRDKRR